MPALLTAEPLDRADGWLAMYRLRASLSLLAIALVCLACTGAGSLRKRVPPSESHTEGASQAAPSGPYVLVLGTAQDAGLPQIGCRRHHCRRARAGKLTRRLTTSLLLCDPRSGKRWLFDASPDLTEQVARAQHHPATRRQGSGRPLLFDGIFLSHAHIGHYTGLMFLGREAYGAREQPVYATARMSAFLQDNGPWSQLVTLKNIVLRPLSPHKPVQLAEDIRVEPQWVPHRDEFSDTVGFIVRGPERSLLYLPDIDKWDRWQRPIEEVLAEVDVALLDGTFFADGEIPGRSMAEIPHPFITESIERLYPLSSQERSKVIFTHLNHTNPALDPDSSAAQKIRQVGMSVAEDGQIFAL